MLSEVVLVSITRAFTSLPICGSANRVHVKEKQHRSQTGLICEKIATKKMAPRKGLSFEEKRERLLDLFGETVGEGQMQTCATP